MLPAPGLRHALVYGDLQVHLPASALGIGAVLPVGHGAFFFLFLLLRLHNRKTILHTQLVRCTAQFHEAFLVAVVLETGFVAHGVDYEMGMDMFPIRVRSNEDLVAGDMLRQLQGDLVGRLRGDRIVRTEGLHHVVVHPSIRASILPLGIHKFQQGSLGDAVDPRDQRASLVGNLGWPAAVGDGTVQTAHGLALLTFRKLHDCHSYHRFLLRMSDSKELTEV